MTRRSASRKNTEPPKLHPAVHVPVLNDENLDDDNVHAPWLDLLSEKEYSSAEARLHDEIMAYVEYITETPEERAVVAHVKKVVEDVLRKPFRQCEVRVFGSTDTGLRLPGSDIDLIIDALDTFDTKNMLMKLSNMLRAKAWCKSVNAILGARVPIISLSTTPEFGSLKLDVGINNFHGLRTGEFVKTQLQTMPTLRSLVFVIKKALSRRNLNDASRSGISSFAVFCMCVFFLQLNPHELSQEYLSSPVDNRSFGFILSGFLKYYSQEIPYRELYISVSQCCLVPKNTASWIHSDCYQSLVIQCPCNPEHNITGTLSEKNFGKIRGIFNHAHHAIDQSTASFSGILNTLVSVDSKFIEYRRQTRQLVESGGIHGDDVRGGGSGLASQAKSSTMQPPLEVHPPLSPTKRRHRRK